MSDTQSDLLKVVNVTKTFYTTTPPTEVLRGIDLNVKRGEFVVIMGASGSGKSTLLYNSSGMDAPSSGQVFFEGRDITSLKEREMSNVRLTQMGFIFQQAYFLKNLTIRDNIILPAQKARKLSTQAITERTDTLMRRFAIDAIGDHGVSEVSGGQLQRASICRSLVSGPEIVFADEPTGALNSSMAAEVMDALSQVHADGVTLVMVTHDPRSAARADRIVYLRDGKIEDECTLGTWSKATRAQREANVYQWLQQRGF